MNMRNTTLALAVAGLTFMGTSLALAEATNTESEKPARKHPLAGPKAEGFEKGERPGPGNGPMAERRGEMMDGVRGALRDLNLTEDQKAQIKTIMDEARDSREKFMDEHKDEVRAIREKMKAAREAKDRDQMKQLGEELRGIMESGPKPQDTMEKIKGVLTPEQRDQLQGKLDQWKENHPRPQLEEGERPRRQRPQGDGEGRKPKAPAPAPGAE